MSDYTPTTNDVLHWLCGPKYAGGPWNSELEAKFHAWLAERDRQVAEKAWDRCVGEMPIDPDWKNFYTDNNPYRKGQNGERY